MVQYKLRTVEISLLRCRRTINVVGRHRRNLSYKLVLCKGAISETVRQP